MAQRLALGLLVAHCVAQPLPATQQATGTQEATGSQAAPETQEAPDFSREVQPILSDKCFLCHGPDASSRKAKLRLDDADQAHESGVLGFDADGLIEFIERITDDDPSFRMPPPEAKLALTPAERDVLVRWVIGGAPYARHWAFEPLPRAVIVPAAGDGWGTSPIDQFIVLKHAYHGLTAAAAAPGARWLRRVTYDLTGLPPTPEEVTAFLADTSGTARETVVDRLLGSPAFGERMATPWLDVARYADSYGYQSDLLATNWPYRDWVVRAINDNLPYDEFLVWQIAGDLLPEATRDQRLATAFNRLHRMTNEGGSKEPEWRHASVVDRVETLGSAVMGLTMGCARCHDHKFDPITQKEFYGLFAYFNSIDEWGLYHDSSRIPTPTMLLSDEATTDRLARLGEIADAGARRRSRSDRGADQDGSLAESTPELAGPGSIKGLVGHFPFDRIGEGRTLENLARPSAPATTGAGNRIVDGHDGNAIRFSGDDALTIPDLECDFTPIDSFSIAFWLRIPEGLEDGTILHRSGGTDVGYFGFDLALADGQLRARQVRFWPGNAAAVATAPIAPGKWHHVAYVQVGTGLAADMAIFLNGNRRSGPTHDSLSKLPSAGGAGLEVGARFRDYGLAGGELDELCVFEQAISPVSVRRLAGRGVRGSMTTIENGERTEIELIEVDTFFGDPPGLLAQREARAEILKEQTALLEVPVMAELSMPREAHVLERGAYDAPRRARNRVERHVPAAIRTGAAPDRADRLGLAGWLVGPDHPLTARVAVNRLWQTLFGVGLVPTAADFGLQGTPPSHPRLLDWLARRFVDSGWDRKALVREIVLSATYGQDSATTREARELDPQNVWLARGHSARLTAEMLRDTALFTSGLLSPAIGGAPVSPYQPPGLWRENNTMSPGYRQSVDEGLYRRSLYSVVKRTAPLPNMIAFDRPMRETSCARRETTATPLQGLVLLNDTQFVEAARELAARALVEARSDPVAAIFLRLTGREPDALEAGVLAELFDAERDAYRANGEAAAAFTTVGDSEPPADLDIPSLAALTVVAQIVFASDSVVMKR